MTLFALFAIALAASAQGPVPNKPATSQFVTVEKDVKLEVLDWGGTGRPLVLLVGLGPRPRALMSLRPN